MKRHIILFTTLGLMSATAQAQQPLDVEGLVTDTGGAVGQGNLVGVVDAVLVNVTGGALPGSPGQSGDDLNNLGDFLGDVQGELASGDVTGTLNTVLANTTSGQLPNPDGSLGQDIVNVSLALDTIIGQVAGGGPPSSSDGRLADALQVLLANTTGGGLPGQPAQIGGDLENIGAAANQVTGELTAADINGALNVVLANTTSGQLPGDPLQLDDDIQNLANFLNALENTARLPGL